MAWNFIIGQQSQKPLLSENFFFKGFWKEICLTSKNTCSLLLIFYYPVKLLRSQTSFNWLIFLIFRIYVGWKFYFRTTLSKTHVVWKFFFYRLFQWKYVYHEKTHALLCWYLIIQSNCLCVRLASIGLFSLYSWFMLAGNFISGQHSQKPMLSGNFFFYRLF